MNQAIWDSTPTGRKSLLWIHDTLPADASEELRNFIRHEVKKATIKQWADPEYFPELGEEEFWKQWKAEREERERENAPPVDDALCKEIKITSAVDWISLLSLLDAIVQRNLRPAHWRLLDQLILYALKVSYWWHVSTGTWRKQHAGQPQTVGTHRSPYHRPVTSPPIDIKNFEWDFDED